MMSLPRKVASDVIRSVRSLGWHTSTLEPA